MSGIVRSVSICHSLIRSISDHIVPAKSDAVRPIKYRITGCHRRCDNKIKGLHTMEKSYIESIAISAKGPIRVNKKKVETFNVNLHDS